MSEFPECSTASCCRLCFFLEWFDWKIWWVRSPSQRKFKLPADLSELHLAWVCYKLGSLFSLWCQQNGGCHEVEGLGKVSCKDWGNPLFEPVWTRYSKGKQWALPWPGSNSACITWNQQLNWSSYEIDLWQHINYSLPNRNLCWAHLLRSQTHWLLAMMQITFKDK